MLTKSKLEVWNICICEKCHYSMPPITYWPILSWKKSGVSILFLTSWHGMKFQITLTNKANWWRHQIDLVTLKTFMVCILYTTLATMVMRSSIVSFCQELLLVQISTWFHIYGRWDSCGMNTLLLYELRMYRQLYVQRISTDW